MEENNLTIGELAKQLSINPKTIRYYEDIKLLPRPNRGRNNYRIYSRDTLNRLHFIKKAKSLGFSLKEIGELLSLRVDMNTTCGDFKNIAEIKVSEVENKIHSLNEIKKALTKLVALCSGEGPTSECPIVETLDTD